MLSLFSTFLLNFFCISLMPVITQRPVQLFLYLIFLTHPCIRQGAQLQTIFIILIMKSTFCKGTTYTLFLEWRMYQRQGDKPRRKETKKTDQQNHRCLNLGFTGRMDKRRWVWQMLRWLSTRPGARTQEEKQERRTIPRFLNLCGRRVKKEFREK